MPSATAIRINSSKASLPRWLGWLALGLVVVFVGIAGTRLSRGPRVVAQVTVVNPSPYTVEVEVTDAHRDGWVLLGATPPKSSTREEDVIDQGATWVFGVRAQGVSG